MMVTMQPAMITQSANIGTCQSLAPGTTAQAIAAMVTVAMRCCFAIGPQNS